jgi:hypothetical protein
MDVKIENRGSHIYLEVNGELKKDEVTQFDEARRLVLDVIALANRTGINKVLCNAENLSGEISFDAWRVF